jgi:hypothetical protein
LPELGPIDVTAGAVGMNVAKIAAIALHTAFIDTRNGAAMHSYSSVFGCCNSLLGCRNSLFGSVGFLFAAPGKSLKSLF